MNRTEFIFALAVVLFIAFMLGWFAHWLITHVLRLSRNEMNEVDHLAQQLGEAEEQRDQAVAYYQQREGDLANQLAQTEAELKAAMGGLRDARQEAEELRAYIEKTNASK